MNENRPSLSATAVAVVLAITAGLPASAQTTDTVIAACMVQFGDMTPTLVTPVVRATLPSLPEGSSNPNTMLILDSGFREMMQEQISRFYKATCVKGSSLDDVRRTIIGMDNPSGNGVRGMRELPYDEVWPALFDRLFVVYGPAHKWVSRTTFSSEPLGSVFSSADNAQAEERRLEAEAAAERARKPLTKVIITGGSSKPPSPSRMTNAEADAQYAADLSAYQAQLAQQQAAVAEQKRLLEEAKRSEAANANRIAAARAAHQAELDRAREAEAAYQQQLRSYREEYRRLTGKDPRL